MFLIGEGERDEKCTEVFLEHGDICVLDGADRSAFHAVPRVIDFALAAKYAMMPQTLSSFADRRVSNYLEQSRVNISLRQISPS